VEEGMDCASLRVACCDWVDSDEDDDDYRLLNNLIRRPVVDFVYPGRIAERVEFARGKISSGFYSVASSSSSSVAGLIEETFSVDNLSRMYEGWTFCF
jgi:hypothetical protein